MYSQRFDELLLKIDLFIFKFYWLITEVLFIYSNKLCNQNKLVTYLGFINFNNVTMSFSAYDASHLCGYTVTAVRKVATRQEHEQSFVLTTYSAGIRL